MHRFRAANRWRILVVVLVLAACQPEATPLPPHLLVAPTETPTSAPVVPIRYGLLPNTLGAVADLGQIDAASELTLLERDVQPDEFGTRFDVLATFGLRPGWQVSPVALHLALLVSPSAPPLDDPRVAAILRSAVNPRLVAASLALDGVQPAPVTPAPAVDIRARLANLGWPDGFDLRLAHEPVPAVAAFVDHLASFGLVVRPRLVSGDLLPGLESGADHLALVAWTQPAQRDPWVAALGAENVIDVLTVPISYWAADGLTITFTASGWPLATR